jgi:DNA repair exonuclease SbcCD nuclease subunit
MKFICTGDLHLKRWDDRVISETGIPKRLSEIIDTVRYMCDYAIKNGINNIKIAGDLNHLKNVVHADAFGLFQDVVGQYQSISFDILHGNHDSSAGEEIKSSIELLRSVPNVRIITENMKEDDIEYVPFSDHMIDDIINSEGCRILISHFGLGDAQLSSGMSMKTRLQSGDLMKYKLVLLGHYHKPQQINHVYYVGSPIQMRRDEAGEEKRFLVVDTETLEVESIPTVGYRKYHELVIEKETDVKEIIERAKELQDGGDYVWVKRRTKDKIEVPKEINLIDDYEEEYQMRGLTSSMDLEQQMTKYLEIKRIPEELHERYISLFSKKLSSCQLR